MEAVIEILKSKSHNYIVTIVIGEEYLNNWKRYFSESWIKYANKYDLGILIVVDDLLARENNRWKKATWQKLLIPGIFAEKVVGLCCYVDSDILINPFAPNIFDEYQAGKVGVVSIRKRLPYPQREVTKRLAYLRQRYLDKDYPLDSSLFMTTTQLYNYHNFADQNDEFCAGVLLFDPNEMRAKFLDWFNLYPSNVDSITQGGDQTHLNFHIISEGLQNWLDYRYQAIWVYEVSWNFRELYEQKFSNLNQNQAAIWQVLANNHFLHFAGGSADSNFYLKLSNINIDHFVDYWKDYFEYQQKLPEGRPRGTYHANTIEFS